MLYKLFSYIPPINVNIFDKKCKWHYFFAVHAATEYYNELFGENWSKDEIKDYPCYLTLELPLKNLLLDEDIFLSQYMEKLYLNHENPFEHVDLKEALAA